MLCALFSMEPKVPTFSTVGIVGQQKHCMFNIINGLFAYTHIPVYCFDMVENETITLIDVHIFNENTWRRK